MINRDGDGYMNLRCDSCGEEQKEQYASADFEMMLEDAKQGRWSIMPDRHAQRGWAHFCPSCASISRVQKQELLLRGHGKPVGRKRNLL